MNSKLFFAILCIGLTLNFNAQVQLGSNLPGENDSDISGQSIAMNGTGNVVVVGAPSAVSDIIGGIFQRGGHVRTYGYNGANWTAGADFDAQNPGDRFGHSVAISLDASIIVCGAPGGNSNQGYIQAYIAQGDPETPTGYIQYGNIIDGDTGSLRFGASLAINSTGTRIIVGGNNYVKVYENDNFATPWTQVGQTLTGENSTDNFGVSVGMDQFGNRIVVGNALSGSSDSGYARVYEFDGNNWIQLGQDIAGATGDKAGHSVDMSHSGLRVAIGFPGESNPSGTNTGAVKTFDYNNPTWVQSGSIIFGEDGVSLGGSASDQEEGALSLSPNGDFLVVGSRNIFSTTDNTGYIEEYQLPNSSNSWTKIGSTILGDDDNDEFGFSVAINFDGTRIAGGARNADDNGSFSGSSKVFDNSGNILGVNDIDDKLTQIKIFPNPASNYINFSGAEIQAIEIYNSTGRLVKKDFNTNRIDVNDLNKGFYLIKLYDINNSNVTKKIIVE